MHYLDFEPNWTEQDWSEQDAREEMEGVQERAVRAARAALRAAHDIISSRDFPLGYPGWDKEEALRELAGLIPPEDDFYVSRVGPREWKGAL